MDNPEIPKDLKLVMGSPGQVYWENALAEAEALVIKGEGDLEINKTIVSLAKEKIDSEKKKWKGLNKVINS